MSKLILKFNWLLEFLKVAKNNKLLIGFSLIIWLSISVYILLVDKVFLINKEQFEALSKEANMARTAQWSYVLEDNENVGVYVSVKLITLKHSLGLGPLKTTYVYIKPKKSK